MKYMEPELPRRVVRTPGLFLRTVKGNWYFLADKHDGDTTRTALLAVLVHNCSGGPIDRKMTPWKFHMLANVPKAQLFKGTHKTYEFRP